MKQLIIGCGTGRCGTMSLAKLLQQQCNTYAEHESKPLLPYKWNRNAVNAKIDFFRAKDIDIVADVCSSYITYVPYLIQKCDARVICLERDADEVVQSFLDKTIGRDHWIIKETYDQWDMIFPKFTQAETKPQAIYMYCLEYRKKSMAYQTAYPDKFKIFDMQDLNTEQGVSDMLEWLGYDEKHRNIITEIKENKTKGRD